MGKVCAKADERDDDDDATHGRRCGCCGHLGSGRSVGLDRVESGVLKIKLARGTTATATVLRLAERVSRGRHAISELRTCSTAQIRFSPSRFSSPLSFSPFLLPLRECVRVFWLNPISKKTQSSVLYKPRPPAAPAPPLSLYVVPFVLSGRPQIPRGVP